MGGEGVVMPVGPPNRGVTIHDAGSGDRLAEIQRLLHHGGLPAPDWREQLLAVSTPEASAESEGP